MVGLGMLTHPDRESAIRKRAEALGIDFDALLASLRLSPAERVAELVRMNRFHHDIQSRTLSPELRAALEAQEIERARARLHEAG